MRIALLTSEMTEKTDPICNDAACQYHFLKTLVSLVEEIRIFSGCYDSEAFPALPVEPTDNLRDYVLNYPETVIIFHCRDSIGIYDDFLREECKHVIIRWHNITPPWFTFGLQNENSFDALLCYENIINYININSFVFWANSEFTKGQLIALGASTEHCQVIYPAHRYINSDVSTPGEKKDFSLGDSLRLLFVSHMAAHKGYSNLIALADRVQEISKIPVQLHIVGKDLDNFSTYIRRDIKNAQSCVIIHDFVNDEELIKLYNTSDVFVSLSEHEGFNLSVFEAMHYHLPVVCWAITSFDTLLQSHPFAFEVFNLDLMASAIIALTEQEVRVAIIKIQNSIVQKYRLSSINGAIRSALEKYGQNNIIDNNNYFIKSDKHIGDVVIKNAILLNKMNYRAYDQDITFDSYGNIVSLYDLKIYNIYSKQSENLIKLLTDPSSNPYINFSPSAASLRKGIIPYDRTFGPIIPEVSRISAQHIMFYPDIQVPEGSYSIKLKIRILNVSHRKLRFEIDIQSGEKSLVHRVITIGPYITNLEEYLDFTVQDENLSMALRVRPEIDFYGHIILNDAYLIKKNYNRIYSIWNNLISKVIVLFNIISLFFRKIKYSYNVVCSYMLFCNAQILSKRHKYKKASKFYKKSLDAYPFLYSAIIKLAYLSEENGDLEQAYMYYERALLQNPSDSELYARMKRFSELHRNILS